MTSVFFARFAYISVYTEMRSIERLPGFDNRLKLKDVDLHKMDFSTLDTTESPSDGLLEEDSLALFNEETVETESQ